jgi:hypothetical protein
MEMSSAPDIRRRPHRACWHPAAIDLGKGFIFSRGGIWVKQNFF